MIGGFRVVDIDATLLGALELVYEESRPEVRGLWDRLVDPHVRIRVETEPEQGDWSLPWLELAVDPLPYLEAPKRGGDRRIDVGALQDRPDRFVAALDADGVDVAVLHPESFAGAAAALEAIGAGLLEGYNSYVGAFCGAAPGRLRAILQLHGGYPEWSVTELERYADAAWVAGAAVRLPPELPPFADSLSPLYAALERTGTPLFHRSDLEQAPHFPGHADVWENAALARALASPWSAQRALAALLLGGVLDRHPRLRVCLADGGAGWLPGWLDRLGHVQGRPADELYAQLGDGRLCAALAPCEREAEFEAVARALGPHSVIWGSGTARTGGPRTPDAVLGWSAAADRDKAAVLAANAERMMNRQSGYEPEQSRGAEE